MDRHFNNTFLIPVKPFLATPGSLKECENSPKSGVSMHGDSVGGNLENFAENFDSVHNKNSAVTKLVTCIINAVYQL